MALTINQKNRLNKDFHPTAQETALGDAVYNAPVVFEYAVTATAAAGLTAFVAPFPMRISFVSVRATATHGNGTLQPRKATDAMCTAITCAVDKVVTNWSEGVESAHITLAAGDTVTVIATGDTEANVRGVITFFGVRL